MQEPGSESEVQVRSMRQILLWPLQLMPLGEAGLIQNHAELLQRNGSAVWREVQARLGDNDSDSAFEERHYGEFATFLPYVQRLFYGEGKQRGHDSGESPIRIFRRTDLAQVRLTYTGADPGPVLFDVVRADLYFFHAIDVVILVLELNGGPISLARAQDTLYRFGRAYPTHWNAAGEGGHCLARVEWLAQSGQVLAVSDYERRERYLEQVSRHRAPCIAAHWEFLLQPLVAHHSDQPGALRYRLVEYHRMPLMAYLAVDDPRRLTRGDFARLVLVMPPGPAQELPLGVAQMRDFEQRYCSDRYWTPERAGSAGTRYLCSGESFVMVGDANDAFFVDHERGLLGQFRHQDFLLFLLPHFHKAALYMMSDRLVDAINHLDVRDPILVRRFKRKIRRLKQVMLGFTHGYWFHAVSNQPQARELYRMCQDWLGSERIYAEVRAEIDDMNAYLDSDALRRQASTVVRLTVVTIFGLIGTITTGFLGMNLFASADEPQPMKLLFFVAVFVPAIWLTFYTIIKSQRLSDFLDALADERLPARAKLGALLDVWRRRRG